MRPPRGRRKWLSTSLTWLAIWLFGPLVAGLLVLAAVGIGPALDAALGHGTPGFFVAEDETCSRYSCSWSGYFALPDGQITRRDVTLNESSAHLHRGSRVPAIDTGGPGEVYARSGSTAWIGDLLGIIFTAPVLGVWTWFIPVRRLRRWRTRRRSPELLMPSSARTD